MKKHLKASNIITGCIILFIIALFAFPKLKEKSIQSLMHLGLFKPQVSTTVTTQQVFDKNIHFINEEKVIIEGSSLSGKVIVLNLWATWCPPCRAEMPGLDVFFRKYQHHADIQFLIVDVDNDLTKANNFLRDNQYAFTAVNLLSPLPESWYNGSIPTTLVFDKQGKMVLQHKGIANFTDKNFLESIEQLLQNSH